MIEMVRKHTPISKKMRGKKTSIPKKCATVGKNAPVGIFFFSFSFWKKNAVHSKYILQANTRLSTQM